MFTCTNILYRHSTNCITSNDILLRYRKATSPFNLSKLPLSSIYTGAEDKPNVHLIRLCSRVVPKMIAYGKYVVRTLETATFFWMWSGRIHTYIPLTVRLRLDII